MRVLAVLQHVRLEVRQRRRRLARSHVGPDHAATLSRRVGLDAHLVLEVALGGLRRHVDAGAVHVELPAVIDAAQSFFFVAAEEHGCAAVGAGVVEQPRSPGAVAEGDEVLAQQPDAHRRAIGRGQLVRAHRWNPVLAHEVAHVRTGSDSTEDFVVLNAEHREKPPDLVSCGKYRPSGQETTPPLAAAISFPLAVRNSALGGDNGRQEAAGISDRPQARSPLAQGAACVSNSRKASTTATSAAKPPGGAMTTMEPGRHAKPYSIDSRTGRDSGRPSRRPVA